MTTHTVFVVFVDTAAVTTLFGPEEMAGDDRKTPSLQISCNPLDWQLAAVAEVLNSFLSFLPTLGTLGIAIYRSRLARRNRSHPMARIFTPVHLCAGNFPTIQGFSSTCRTCPSRARRGKVNRSVACSTKTSLRGVRQLSKPVQKAIEQFVAI